MHREWRTFLAVAATMLAFAATARAQTVIKVYGPGGPAPAMKEAAAAFASEHKITVNVVAGPTPQWAEQAKQDADVIFSGAENDVRLRQGPARRVRSQAGLPALSAAGLHPCSARQPKGDTGRARPAEARNQGAHRRRCRASGRVGGRHRAHRRRRDGAGTAQQHRVPRGAEQCRCHKQQWTEQPEIDVWLIWNIWQVSNPQLADVVEIEEPYRIYRDTGVVLTSKGTTTAQARAFVEFLNSPAAAVIFGKWGWRTR